MARTKRAAREKLALKKKQAQAAAMTVVSTVLEEKPVPVVAQETHVPVVAQETLVPVVAQETPVPVVQVQTLPLEILVQSKDNESSKITAVSVPLEILVVPVSH